MRIRLARVLLLETVGVCRFAVESSLDGRSGLTVISSCTISTVAIEVWLYSGVVHWLYKCDYTEDDLVAWDHVPSH